MGRRVVVAALAASLPACVLFTNFDELSEPVPATPDSAPASGDAAPGAYGAGVDGPVDVRIDGSSLYRAAVLADNPVVYWRMDLSGATSIVDETGRGNNLVVEVPGTAAPGALAADPSQALAFDGTASKAHATEPAALAFAGKAPFTIELWLKRIPFAQHDEYQQILDHAASPGGAANAVGYYLYYSRDSDKMAFLRRGAGEPTLVVSPMPANVYIHYAVTYDGATLRAILDGTIVDAVPATDSIGSRTSDFILGWNGSGGSFYPGLIDELALYDRALSIAELSRHRDAALAK